MKKITLTDFEKNHKRKIISWRYRLALLFGVFFWGVSSFAQTIQLGSGSTTNSYLPIYYLYDKNYTQTIYTAAELTQAGASATGGTITKIRFKPTSSVTTLDWRNWTIYMDNTSKTGFESNTDWIPIGDLTQVFSGNIPDNTVANTWMEITLDTPFVWDGSNVAIAITETTPDWGGSPGWASYTLAPSVGFKAIYKYQDGDDISIISPPSGTRVNAVAQIQFDGTLQLGCTGIPNAGTASLSTASGNSGATFTATATGVTGATGLTFQWQKNVEGTWENIDGATALTSTITAQTGAIGDSMEYRLAVTCTASGETTYSTPATFTIALTYCTPIGGANNADEIRNFTLNNLNNNSAASEGVAGYKDYSGTVAPAQLEIGVPYIATVTGGTGSGSHGAAIWIDYNQNGTFEASEKVAFIGNTIAANATAPFPEFVVPDDTPLGIYRLRVQYHYSKSGELLDPCTLSSTFSETEDYNVQILPTPTCLQPSGLTVLNTTSSSAELSWISPGTSFDVEWGLQGFVPGTGTTTTDVVAPYEISNLSSNTSYSFYVRRNCGVTDGLSLWTGPYTFKTPCAAVTNFYQNFDTSVTGSTAPMPDCWKRAGNGSTYITTGSVAPLSPANRLYLSASATTPTDAYAVMPPVSNLQAETHRLRFKGYATATGKSIEIGYFELAGDASSFIVLETFEMPSTVIANSQEFTYTPQFVPNGIETLAFKVNGAAFTGTTTIYIDDVYWEVLPSCPDITEFEIENLGSTTADIYWNPGEAETAWQYVYAESAVTDPSTLTPEDIINNPYLSLVDLLPTTTYKLWVRSNCGSGLLGNWSDPLIFTTTCAPAALPWTEGFEGITTVGTTAFPPCWFEENGDWASSSATTNNTPKSGTKYIRNSWTATNEYIWTPGFELTAGTSYDFSFYMQGDGFTGWNVDIFHNSVQNSVDAIQIGETIIAPGSGTIAIQPYTLVKNTFIPNSSGVHYFAIRVNETTGSPWYIAFDDFKFEVTPTCIAPAVDPVSVITSTTASVTWSSSSVPADGYEYFLTTDSAIIPNASTTPTGTIASTSSSLDLTDLTPSTVYYVYVKSLCSSSDVSSWSNMTSFKTLCAEVATFSENFDTNATGTTSPMPTCWSKAGNGSTYVTTGGAAPGTAPNRLYMFASGTATVPTVAYAIMPPVSNLQANTHRLKFKAYATTANKYIEIGYLTNTTDLESFVLLETINLPGTTAATAQTFTFESADIPAGISSLVFRNPGTPTASTTLYIDDVIWEAKPSVAPNCATNIVATPNALCGNFATPITWNATPDTDGYYLTIGTTDGGTDVVNNQNIGLVTSYNFVGTLNTTYYFSVVPFNSAGPATGCTSQTFTTSATGCYCTSVPTSNDALGITNVLIGTQNFPNGDVMYFDHTATPVDLSQGVLSNLKITLATGYTYNNVVWIDFNDNFTFEADEIVFEGESTNANPVVFDASFLMPLDAPLGLHRMRIVSTDAIQNPANPCYNGTYGVTLDFNINVIVVPTCFAPTALTVDSNQITTNSVTVTWTAPTTTASNGYEYYYTSSTTPPTSATTPSGTFGAGSISGNITGLDSSTLYRLYIRSVCSDNDRSAWSQEVIFTTLCDISPLPYTINFESVTVPALPICTSNQNAGTGNNWVTVNNPGNGFTTKTLKYGYNLSNAANTWFFTNRVTLAAGTQYSITYKYGSSSTSYVEKLKVAYGSSANSTSMTTELADHPSITTATLQNNTVTFTPAVSGEYVFGFNAYSIANQFNLYVDDIVIQEVLSNGDFDNKSFTAYPNPVKDELNIRFVENISSVTVYNILGQELFVKNINNTEGQIDMSNLASGTYLVKVISGNKAQTIKVIKE